MGTGTTALSLTNRSVNNVSNVSVTNVYNKTVINNTTVNRTSFNGGTGGVKAQPTAQGRAAVRENLLGASAKLGHSAPAWSGGTGGRVKVVHRRIFDSVGSFAMQAWFMGHRRDVRGWRFMGRVRRAVRVEGRSPRAVAGSLGYRERRYGRCWSTRCRPATSDSSRSSGPSLGHGWASSTPF